jgi:hypothetical protein
MKFDYAKTYSADNSFWPEYHFKFKFVLKEIEIKDVCNRHGQDLIWVDHTLQNANDTTKKCFASFLIQQSLGPIKNDLDIVDYKAKYQEMVDLLEPYKIDDDVSPTTTLKMILKYHNK